MLERLICHDPGLVRLERGFWPRVRGLKYLTQASNTMDQAWFTLTQARNVLTLARNALTEASFVADETWSGWARRGERTCKWRWGAGLVPLSRVFLTVAFK